MTSQACYIKLTRVVKMIKGEVPTCKFFSIPYRYV